MVGVHERHNTAGHGSFAGCFLFFFVPVVMYGEEGRSPPAFSSVCEPLHRLIEVLSSGLCYISDIANVFFPPGSNCYVFCCHSLINSHVLSLSLPLLWQCEGVKVQKPFLRYFPAMKRHLQPFHEHMSAMRRPSHRNSPSKPRSLFLTIHSLFAFLNLLFLIYVEVVCKILMCLVCHIKKDQKKSLSILLDTIQEKRRCTLTAMTNKAVWF